MEGKRRDGERKGRNKNPPLVTPSPLGLVTGLSFTCRLQPTRIKNFSDENKKAILPFVHVAQSCYDIRYNFWSDILRHKLHCQYLFQQIEVAAIAIAIAIVRFNVCPHSTDLYRRVFDIQPYATAILQPKQHKDGASEFWNLYSSKISLFLPLLWVYKYVSFRTNIHGAYTNSSYKDTILVKLLRCLSTQHRPPPTCFRYSTILHSSSQR